MTLKWFRKFTMNMPDNTQVMYHSYDKGCSITPYDPKEVWIHESSGSIVMNPGKDYDGRKLPKKAKAS